MTAFRKAVTCWDALAWRISNPIVRLCGVPNPKCLCLVAAEQDWELECEKLPDLYSEFHSDVNMRKTLPLALYGAIRRAKVNICKNP